MRTLPVIQKSSDIIFLFATAFLVVSFSLLFKYQRYLELKQFYWTSVDATVLSQQQHFTKEHKPYYLFRCKTNYFEFTTSSFKPFKDLTGKVVTLDVNTKNLSFLNYLQKPYLKASFKGVSQDTSLRYKMINWVHTQHAQPMIQNLYGALFFVEPIQPELRKKLSALGVNHLAALSGFHLGLLSAFILALLYLPYKTMQQQFFPYRSYTKDSMTLTLLLLFAYVAFLGFTPSLLRSFTMLALGFYLYLRGFTIISVQTLALTVLIVLALFPDLLFSLSFWFSVVGVYMVILMVTLLQKQSNTVLFIGLHFGVFLLMVPFTLYVFKTISMAQLFSPVLSMLFIVFYPLSIVLHLIHQGDLLDQALLSLFDKTPSLQAIQLQDYLFWIFIGTLVVSLISKKLYLLPLTSASVIVAVSFLV